MCRLDSLSQILALQLYVATVPMFSAYGKLHTGLMRLELRSPGLDMEMQRNEGLLPPPRNHHFSAWQDGDKVWKASRMLDQLERFEEVKVDPTSRAPTNKAFGEIQPVPWLDALAKQYCYNTLNEAKENAMVRLTLSLTKGILMMLTVPYSPCFSKAFLWRKMES